MPSSTGPRISMDKNEAISKIAQEPEDRLLLSRVWDKYDQCQRRNIPTATSFLSPRERAMAVALLNTLGVRRGYQADGGYEGAERQILAFLPDWAEDCQDQLRFLRAEFPKQEPAPAHRDLLGSLMGLGITREKLGDILVGDHSADLVVAPTLADFLLENWISAGRTHIRVKAIDRWELLVPEEHVEEVRTTVSTLRLDALVAAAFPMSRSKAADLIRAGKVSLDHLPSEKPDRLLQEGSLITARGYGRVQLETINGETRKGRLSVVLKKYL